MPHLTLSWVPHSVAAGYVVDALVNRCATPLYQNCTHPSGPRDSLNPMTNLFHEPTGSGAFQMCWLDPSGEMSWKYSCPSPRVRRTNGPTLYPPGPTPSTCIWNSAIQAPLCVGSGDHSARHPR